MKVLFPLCILVFGLFFSCKKKQPEMNNVQNACDCANEVSADFLIEEMSAQDGQSWNFYTSTDTIWSNHNVRFRVIEKNAEVKWYLGQEIESGDQVFRHFDTNLGGQSLPIICVVKKSPNKKCFPADDGYDSIVKYVHVSGHSIRDSTYLLQGTFRMKKKYGVDSVDITIDFRHTSVTSLIIDLFNYDGQGTNYLNQQDIFGYNYREIKYGLNAHVARIYNSLNGEVQLDIIGNSSSFPSFLYTGRKL